MWLKTSARQTQKFNMIAILFFTDAFSKQADLSAKKTLRW